ncbi:PREDICTED: bromodomain adjacent to zinc finger domain protein 1A isoform X2 [Ceratosolen solmsi marchali]|uniref:Bromodomain adjacent to zinc finger domain protein 1A n=1 Tax=Ceratosolen solmsi marchali TaxID=326594 RepID=A0AAJ7E1G9_9HYME|nr:PREDICTED: bromodomain adjacent to zinc finger domain protein 1A isoform X2 [Ceratosolen solmsi marchali]
MPLLRKKPFQRLHVSSDFREDDEVFHCAVTNEIFKDYNEFCERIILCNSMIWSCSITGRSGMTYEEALQCEEHAKASLKEFPMELRIPILYLASKTSRTSFGEMIEDIYQYARERYFIGEMVEASFTEDSWCECHVLQVIEPTQQQINAFNLENSKSPQDRLYYPPAKLFRYEVEQLDCGDTDVSQLMIVEASQVRRRKQQYSRERNKIFLRMLCEQNTNGVWIVKESVLQKYGIIKTRFDSLFAGPLPDFTPRPRKIIKQKQESLDKFLVSDVSKHRTFDKPDPLKKINSSDTIIKKNRKPRLNGKFKEELKAKALEEKAKRKEERLEKKERKKEEKIKQAALAAYVRKWNKPREDLECEDLKPLPIATPLKCPLLNEKFGDFAIILEFLQFFHDEIEVKTWFPNGLTLEVLEKAIMDKEIIGPLNDLIQLLLANIFKYQAEEEDEIHAEASEAVTDNNVDQRVSSMAEAVKLATMASSWSQTHQGCQLSEIALDYYTMSEILRQHLLSSGGRISEAASKWRYSQRGGYTNQDDPALLLRIEKPRILRLLSHRNICEFNLEDRLTVVICLINQLLTFASIRDIIDERYEKLFQAKKELKYFIIAEQKKEKEEREKLKEKEKDGKIEEEDPERKKITRNNYKEEKKKEEFEAKLKDLQEASRDDQMMVLLGSDRAYRKYWRLLSIPGVFVENVDSWSGHCLPEGTPYMPELADTNTLYSYLKNKFEDECSDKENSFKKNKSPKKVSFSDKNGVKSPRKDTKKDIHKTLMVCTGNKDCPVHINRIGPKWSFYGKEQDIDNLIDALSERGIRESELRNNLVHEKESLIAAIDECPKHKFNSDVFAEMIKDAPKLSKKNKVDNTHNNYSPDMTLDDILELTLRDYVLDLEDKIKMGCLGSLKVVNRDTWRNAINNRKYDKQCDKLVYGLNETAVDFAVNVALDKIKTESKSSRPGTPDSEVGSSNTKAYRDPGKYLGPPDKSESLPDSLQQTAIKQLACAILQISQAIEHKYLKKPLGVDDKDKKWSSEEARDRWEQSLMSSTSWSQLFVHLNTLDNSIAWSRSASNAQCRICRKRRDAENMLLCDGCNKGHHIYCLKPKLTAVPEGDWFCYVCKPREVKSKEKAKKRRKFEDEIDEDTTLTKETRHSRARRIVDSDEDEEEERDTNQEEDSDEEISKSTQLCAICDNDGKLVACVTCPKFYHIDCLDPPLTRVPRGRWSCTTCKSRKSNPRPVVKGREKERETERSSAAAARSRIHGFAKSLLTKEPKDWDDSSASEETEQPRQTRRSAKRAAEVEMEEEKITVKGCKALFQELVHDVTRHRDSWPFLSPVTKDEVPDYYDYISEPMDFGTIKKKLEHDNYRTIQTFYSDCLLVFDNCQTYNTEHSAVYKAGMRLLKFFEKRCKELNLNYDEDAVRQPHLKLQKIDRNGDQNGLEHSDDDSNHS